MPIIIPITIPNRMSSITTPITTPKIMPKPTPTAIRNCVCVKDAFVFLAPILLVHPDREESDSVPRMVGTIDELNSVVVNISSWCGKFKGEYVGAPPPLWMR